jgi:hypothetical protein
MKTRILDLSYSVGASIVIFGAWSKIEHYRFADTALTFGLLTEVIIFLIYGIQAFTSKTNPTTAQSEPVQPNVSAVIDLLEQQNAILRDVYKTSK